MTKWCRVLSSEPGRRAVKLGSFVDNSGFLRCPDTVWLNGRPDPVIGNNAEQEDKGYLLFLFWLEEIEESKTYYQVPHVLEGNLENLCLKISPSGLKVGDITGASLEFIIFEIIL